MSNRRRFEQHYAFASELWTLCETLSKKLSGRQVMDALETTSGLVYHVGYDDAFQRLRHGKELAASVVGSHDVGWLTVFAVELQKRVAKRRKGN